MNVGPCYLIVSSFIIVYTTDIAAPHVPKES